MKKIYPVLLTVMMIITVFAFGNTHTYANNDATLTAASVLAENDTASVTISLNGNTGIWGMKFKVGYDHSAMNLTLAKNGNIFSDDEVTMPDRLDKEEYVYFASSNGLHNISKDGTVLTLDFKLVDYAAEGTYPISLTLVQAINLDGKDVDIDTKDGAVTVEYAPGKEDLVFNKSNNEQLTIPLETGGNIKKVEINGSGVYTDDYQVDEKQNLVIHGEDINSLPDGRHKVTVVTEEGTTTRDIYVKSDVHKEPDTEAGGENDKTVSTGTINETNKLLIPIVLIVALGLITVLVLIMLKKRGRKI